MAGLLLALNIEERNTVTECGHLVGVARKAVALPWGACLDDDENGIVTSDLLVRRNR